MAFLNPRRPKADTAVKQAPEKKRRRRDKIIDTEAQMSRYFTAKRPEEKDDIMDQEHKRPAASVVGSLARGSGDADRSARVSSLPPVDLPDRPFLGFGSSGATLTSPIKITVHRDVTRRRPTRSESRSSRRSSVSSSSYYSWSTSAPSRRHDHHSEKNMVPAKISHELHETPQAHSPGPQRSESIPNKRTVIEPQGATDRGLCGKQQVVAEEKPASRPPSASINPHIESQEEKLSHDILPGPREAVVQEAYCGRSAQTFNQIPLDEKDGRTCLALNTEHHDHLSALKPRRDYRARFPHLFDTALDGLLQTCNVSVSRSEDPMANSIGNEPSNQNQSRESLLGTNERGHNVGVMDQTKPFTSDRNYRDEQAFNSGSGPRSSTFKTTAANDKATSNLPQPENTRNPSPKSLPKVSKLQTHSPKRTRLGHQTTGLQSPMKWHPNEQEHDYTSTREIRTSFPSGAWHGYQALYENQIFPDDGADEFALDADVQDRQDEQEWFQHHALDANGPESELRVEGTDENLFYDQQGLEDGHTGSHDWESTTHPPYDEFEQRRSLDDNYIDYNVRHQDNYRFSDSGYGRSTIASGKDPQSPISTLGRPNDNPLSEARGIDSTSNVYEERISHRWRPARIDDHESHLVDFWRPNKLY